MSAQDNKRIARQMFQEVFNNHSLSAFDELLSPHFVRHTAPPGARDRETYKQFHAKLQQAFPDLRVEIEDVIAEDDRVVVRMTATGTNLGPFMGNEPTGKSFSLVEIFVMRIAGGLIVEMWSARDVFSLLQQIGLAPALAVAKK